MKVFEVEQNMRRNTTGTDQTIIQEPIPNPELTASWPAVEGGIVDLSTVTYWEREFEFIEQAFDKAPDLVCFSPLRWDSGFQRPQQLMTRCARERRIFFIEEPVFASGRYSWLELNRRDNGVCVVVPHLPAGISDHEAAADQRFLLDEFFDANGIDDYILWYFTPMALPFTRHLNPLAVVYDCID